MSKADQVAVKVKHQLMGMAIVGITPKRILLGTMQWQAITNNPDPCREPDFQDLAEKKFCGVHVVEVTSFLDLVAYEL